MNRHITFYMGPLVFLVYTLMGCGRVANVSKGTCGLGNCSMGGESIVRKTIEHEICAWVRENTAVTNRFEFKDRESTLYAYVTPLWSWPGRCDEKIEGTCLYTPTLEYNNDGKCFKIESIPAPFTALYLDGDFLLNPMATNGQLRYIEWINGVYYDSGFITNMVSCFPSLRQVAVSMGRKQSNKCLSAVLDETVDVFQFSTLSSLQKLKLSVPATVKNADVLLKGKTTLDLEVDVILEDTPRLHDYLRREGRLTKDGCSDVKLKKQVWSNANDVVGRKIVDGCDELVVYGVFDVGGVLPEPHIRGLCVTAKTVDGKSFQKMIDVLADVVPNIEWLDIKTSFCEAEVFDVGFLRKNASLVTIGINVENGVIVNMDVCKELTKLVACDISFFVEHGSIH